MTESPTIKPDPNAGQDLYPSLLAANRAAFEAGHYETAYHALMAALHSAEDGRDYTRLDEIAVLAEAQQATVDSGKPQHRLSSPSAALHGHKGVYLVAASQARARATMLRRQLARQPR